MREAHKITTDVLSGNIVETKESVESALYDKINIFIEGRKKVLFGELDPVNKKALKGKHKDRNDKDIDNDGDVDSSDKFLHKKRKAITKAMKNEDFGGEIGGGWGAPGLSRDATGHVGNSPEGPPFSPDGQASYIDYIPNYWHFLQAYFNWFGIDFGDNFQSFWAMIAMQGENLDWSEYGGVWNEELGIWSFPGFGHGQGGGPDTWIYMVWVNGQWEVQVAQA